MTPEELERMNKLEADLKALNEEVYLNNFTASQDFNKYSRFNTRMKFPTLSALPTVCEQGEGCVLSTNGKLYICSAANTWTAQT